jgi:hypothetical protein
MTFSSVGIFITSLMTPEIIVIDKKSIIDGVSKISNLFFARTLG